MGHEPRRWRAGADHARKLRGRSSGPRTGSLGPDAVVSAGTPAEIERQVLYWFDPVGGLAPFTVDRFPIYIWDRGAGQHIYGFPAHSGPPGGVKVAFYHGGGTQRCTADTLDRRVGPGEVAAMRQALDPCIPDVGAGTFLRAVTCMYTLTPDSHFVIGLHPHHPEVVVASPCSGHGFKFASVVGEILAELAILGSTRHAIDLFTPTRFLNS